MSKDFIIDFVPGNFLLHITTAGFWVMGNYDGMWYVAVSIVHYLLFPLYLWEMNEHIAPGHHFSSIEFWNAISISLLLR